MSGDGGAADEQRQQWIDIQTHTFTNWMNEQVSNQGMAGNLKLESRIIRDLAQDLSDGVLLIRVVEALQGRKYFGKIYQDNPTEIQKLMNVQMALDALREDGVKTVNIGSHDIVECNNKLVLGLVWSLVQRYQIASRTKIPPKKLVMAWIQSILPELKLTNFRTNWNDGKALSALLEYCQPGLCPEWKRLDPSHGLANCTRAIQLAELYLGIPAILLPEHLSSPHLDELSCVTYLSYFITRGAPGYRATLRRVQMLIPDCEVQDFELSWSDGYLLTMLVDVAGGRVHHPERMRFETFEDCVENIANAMDAAAEIGVGSLVGPEDIANCQGEHLGTMALAAALCTVGPETTLPSTECFTHQQVNLDLAFADGSEVRVDELDVRVLGPSGRPLSNETIRLRKSRTIKGAVLSMIPMDAGYHQVRIFCQDVELPTSPLSLQVLSQEESRAASRASSRPPPIAPPPPPLPVNPPPQKTSSGVSFGKPATSASSGAKYGAAPLEKSDSESDVDISHKSFQQRRLHIIKQLEAQNAQAATKEAPPPQLKELVNRAENRKIVTLEASAHHEMPLSRPSDVGLVSFSGLTEPCSVGSIVEVVINAHGDSSSGSVYVEAISPTGRVLNCSVSKRANSYMATFTPQEVGLWKIGILYDGEHIRGSPFACQVFDAGLVNVYGLDVGLVGQELRFTVNASQAGHGDIRVSVLRHGRDIPAKVEEQGSSRVYRINFVPDGAGQYNIHVLFNRMEVKGSPFILDIADASSVSVYGENLRMASVGRVATFMIHAVGADTKDIKVNITEPTGRKQLGRVHPIDDVSYRVEWTAREPGEHSIDVLLYDQSVYDSPFSCSVGAPELVAVRSMPRRIQSKDLNTDHNFEIDASAAGSGNLEIMINGGRVPCRVRELGSRQYMAIFTPSQSMTHTVEMRFNGEEVAGSPWKIPVEDRTEKRQEMNKTMSYYSELSGAGLVRAPVNRMTHFDITGDGLELSDIQAKIFGPDGREFPIRIVAKTTGKFVAEYEIEQVGEHHLTVWIAGRVVDGSPLSVAGYSSERVKLEPLGGGAPGQPVQFVVDAVDAGKGQLEISVNQGRVPNNVQMQGAGRCLVTFIPQHPGVYVIDVTFNGEQVHGCPIKVEILPKQVGQQVQANLTPTAVSTAISAGGSSISGAFRTSGQSSSSPASPGLLKHVRQRSVETEVPRSAVLLQDQRSRQEKPWMSSYAPVATSRVSSSLSPQREYMTKHTTYEERRVISPVPPEPPRLRQEVETRITREVRVPSPTGVRSRAFAARQEGETPSPTKEYRSPSPLRETFRSATSPYRRTPSPGLDERIRRIERIDPLAEEEERERRRAQADRQPVLGYTVAQYGQPGDVTLERSESPERTPSAPIRHFGDTLEKDTKPRNALGGIISTYEKMHAEDRKRASSPEYSTVYEKYERKSPVPPAPAHGVIERRTPTERPQSRESERTVEEVYRSPSPPADYDSTPSRPALVEHKTHLTHSASTTAAEHLDEHKGFTQSVKEKKEPGAPGFFRTQSDGMDNEKDTAPHVLHRSEEKESIYDTPPADREESSLSAYEREQRKAEYLRVKAEDERILEKHGLNKRSEPSIEIQTPISELRDDVVERVGSHENLGERSIDVDQHVETLHPAAELPHSPAPSSKPTTPHTTPKTSMKFKKEGKESKPFDFGKSKFSSKHEVIKRGKEVEVKLDSLKLGKEDTLRIVVMPPIRATQNAPTQAPAEVEAKVKKNGSKYEISFKPTDVGTHKIFAYVNEVQHPLSPYPIRVYDASEIVVGEIPEHSSLNDTVEFTVDAGRAGFGNLEMAIKDADNVIIPSHVAQLESGSAKFLVTFTPATKGAHTVNITFNKEVLKNSPFEVIITEPSTPVVPAGVVEAAAVEGTASPSLTKKELKKEKEDKKKEEKERAKREKEEKAATLKKEKKSKHRATKTTVTKIPSLSRVGQITSLIVEVAGHDALEVLVTDNKKNHIGTNLSEVEPGLMQIDFTPASVGDHEIDVRYGGAHVTGSPFTCRAYDPGMIKVGKIPKGVVEKPVYFTVDASEAGVGNLEVAVNEGRVPSMAHALGNHKYDISFVPQEAHDHTITVRFNNEPVPGSPFTCEIVSAAHASATGPGLERVPVDQETEIEIHTDGSTESSLEIRVRDPQLNEVPVNISRSSSDKTLTLATYTPRTVGNHQVDISVQGDPIAGSPFTAKAYDARMARLTPCEKAVVGKPCTFLIDAARAGAGNMEIIVSVDNKNVPNFVQAEGQAKFKVSFTPQEAKEHVISVRFNSTSVPGSPMRCPVEPAVAEVIAPVISQGLTGHAPESRSRTAKTGLAKELQSAKVGQKMGFTVENLGGRVADCNVVIVAPDGNHVPATVTRPTEEEFKVEFTPVAEGSHAMDIFLDNKKLNEVPILFEVAKSTASLPATCLVGKKYHYDIDALDKDSVRVEIREPNGKALPVQVEQLPEGGVRASCRFKQVGSHSVDTYVLDEPVGDRIFVDVVDPLNGVQLVSELQKEVVGQPTEQKILIDSGLEGEVNVEVEGPDRTIYTVYLQKVSEKLWSVSWTPKIEGDHQLSISVGGTPISGSPFAISVLDPSAVRVIGLRNERVGVEQQFNVNYTSSGARSASVEVKCGNRMVPCVLKEVKPGLLVCTFTPNGAGTHTIDVFIDGLLLSECPYEVFITDAGSVRATGDALKRAQRSRTARFEVSLNDATRGELDVLVSDPRGGPVPVRCYKQQDDSYWVEFTPEQMGTHTIEVTFGDTPVTGSPFKCEVVDPKRVAVRGIPEALILRNSATIAVDRRDAGPGELQVEVTDPQGAPLRVEMLKSPGGEDRATFLPSKTGPHKLNVKMAGFQIPGYPQTLMVGEQEMPEVYGAAIDQSIKINEPASLIFDPKKANGGLKINVQGPRDNKVPHKVMRRQNGTSEVVFYPDEVGTYTASIDFNSKKVSGSPYTIRVVDPSKVIVNDLDMDRDGSLLLRLGSSNVFDVDATAAGPGKLSAEVRDADSVLLGDGPVVDDLGYGKYRVGFNPKKPGRYAIYLYWNELPVESAFPVRARSTEEQPTTSREFVQTQQHSREKSASHEDDVMSVMVRGDGLHRAALKESNEFIVDGSDMSREGRVTATLLGTKADVPVRVQQLGHNIFKATYTPLTGGVYELHILWNGKHVHGSPYKVSVDTSTSPADLIVVDSSSLKIGIVNEDIKTVIDTRRSGPGQLSAQCMGPVKLAYCELYDHRDGTYTLSIRPSEVGKHVLTIKYNDVHVKGSPFLVHVSLPPDPSKVKVHGPGIEHGILSMFKSNFIVETRGAGAGQLTVRVRGPKGAFNVEMQREKKNERTIHCKYEPKEPGDYQVEVKWHGEHVPGSPFLVMIVDTEQELSRFLRGEAPSPTPATPFVPPGWVGPPPMFHPLAGPRPPFMGPPPPMGGPMGPPPGAMGQFAPPLPRHKTKYH